MAVVYEEVRLVSNAGEEDQKLYLGWDTEDGPPDRASASGWWRDGSYSCGYDLGEDGRYLWWRGRESGFVATAEEAWVELPRLIADPDHAEELSPGISELAAARWAHEYTALRKMLDEEGRRRLLDLTFAAGGPPTSSELREMRRLETVTEKEG